MGPALDTIRVNPCPSGKNILLFLAFRFSYSTFFAPFGGHLAAHVSAWLRALFAVRNFPVFSIKNSFDSPGSSA
jgi:hypothetical protein